MKAGADSTPHFGQRLFSFLLTYRTTPHATTNVPPCELFVGRRLRTLFDLLRPNRERRVNDRQGTQKAGHDNHAHHREFEISQHVMARNWSGGPNWLPGVIVDKHGPLTFEVKMRSGQIWKRHVDHLKPLLKAADEPVTGTSDDYNAIPTDQSPVSESNQAPAALPEDPPVARRYPTRNRQCPDRLMDIDST